MASSAIIVFFSFLLTLLLVWAFFVLYVKSLLKEVWAHGSTISEKIRLRLDMIPIMIETVKRHSFSDTELIADIVRIRQKSWPIEGLSIHKVHAELSMSAALHAFWEKTVQYQDLQKDIHFLELHAEIHAIGKHIEKLQDFYNHKIRLYNKKVNFFLLKPFLGLFRLHPMSIFEFEA